MDCKIAVFVDLHEESFPSFVLAGGSSWHAGEILTTDNLTTTASLLKISGDSLAQYCKQSTPAELRIYHLPTSSILFKDTIILEERS